MTPDTSTREFVAVPRLPDACPLCGSNWLLFRPTRFDDKILLPTGNFSFEATNGYRCGHCKGDFRIALSTVPAAPVAEKFTLNRITELRALIERVRDCEWKSKHKNYVPEEWEPDGFKSSVAPITLTGELDALLKFFAHPLVSDEDTMDALTRLCTSRPSFDWSNYRNGLDADEAFAFLIDEFVALDKTLDTAAPVAMQKNIDALKELKPGWDGYKSAPPAQAALDTAAFMCLVPGADGSLQYEIHAGGADIEIGINTDGSIGEVYVERNGVEQVAGEDARIWALAKWAYHWARIPLTELPYWIDTTDAAKDEWYSSAKHFFEATFAPIPAPPRIDDATSLKLHRINLGTMQETVARCDRWDRPHSELDAAIRETRDFLAAFPPKER